jgi:hypothetical protein
MEFILDPKRLINGIIPNVELIRDQISKDKPIGIYRLLHNSDANKIIVRTLEPRGNTVLSTIKAQASKFIFLPFEHSVIYKNKIGLYLFYSPIDMEYYLIAEYYSSVERYMLTYKHLARNHNRFINTYRHGKSDIYYSDFMKRYKHIIYELSPTIRYDDIFKESIDTKVPTMLGHIRIMEFDNVYIYIARDSVTLKILIVNKENDYKVLGSKNLETNELSIIIPNKLTENEKVFYRYVRELLETQNQIFGNIVKSNKKDV